MSKQLLATVLGGVVWLIVPLVAGCSSPDGRRTCRKEVPTPAANLGPTVPTGAAAPAAPGGAAATDRLYGGQKTCPVTGEELGAMGKPVAVTVKGRTVYVCCRGCADKAQADPDKTLAAAAEQAQW